jgi:TonB family protein
MKKREGLFAGGRPETLGFGAILAEDPAPMLRLPRHLRLVTLLALCATAGLGAPARAYEGAGMAREEEAPPAPKPPQLTKAPSIEQFVEAEYPVELLEANVGGDVTLLIEIAADGSVPNAEVAKSSGQPGFDAAAVDALKKFRFSPAEFDGKPGPVRLEFLYRFEPRAPPPPPPEAPKPQVVNLKGRVLERGSREPIPNASVYVPGAELVAETDAAGAFELKDVPTGKVKVEISEPRHRKFATEEEIRAGEVTELTAYLWPKIENGFEVVVRAEREKKEVSRRTLEAAELRSVPGTFGDPVRVIQNMPGMARAAFSSGALLVRGAQPQDTGIYIDGVPIPILYHFGGGPSVINPSFIDRIDFFPGAYGAKYGRAIAGIVDVGTRPSEARQLHGNVDIDFFDAGFFLEGPVWPGKDLGQFSIAGRRSYYDVFLPLILELGRAPGQGSVSVLPRYWDYQARYDLKLGSHRFEASAFGSSDLLDVAVVGDAETQDIALGTQQGFHRFRLRWSYNAGDGLSVYLAPVLGATLVNANVGDQVKVDIASWDLNLRGAVVKEFSPQLKVEAGVDGNSNKYDVDLLVPRVPDYLTFPGEFPTLGIERRRTTIQTQSAGFYADAVWNPAGGLKLVPGLRAEVYNLPRGQVVSPEPRLSGRYDFGKGTAVKASWGVFRQGPLAQNLGPTLGNPNLTLSRSEQTVVGFEQQLLPKLSLDVQAFYNWRTDLVVGSSAIVERDGQRVRENFRNGGVGQAYGLEVLLKQDITERFFGWIAYTLSRSEQRNESESAKAGRTVYTPVSFDQTHNLIVVGSYKLDDGWEVGTRFRFTSGRPATPVDGSYYDANTNGWRRVNGEPGSIRGALFHQLDLRVEKTFTFETWRMSAFLDVQNVYNAPNPEATLYNYRFSQSADLKGIPFLPTLGVTGAF